MEFRLLQVEKRLPISGYNLLFAIDVAAGDAAEGPLIFLVSFFDFQDFFMFHSSFSSGLFIVASKVHYTIEWKNEISDFFFR
jgi:hypothetical protein